MGATAQTGDDFVELAELTGYNELFRVSRLELAPHDVEAIKDPLDREKVIRWLECNQQLNFTNLIAQHLASTLSAAEVVVAIEYFRSEPAKKEIRAAIRAAEALRAKVYGLKGANTDHHALQKELTEGDEPDSATVEFNKTGASRKLLSQAFQQSLSNAVSVMADQHFAKCKNR